LSSNRALSQAMCIRVWA